MRILIHFGKKKKGLLPTGVEQRGKGVSSVRVFFFSCFLFLKNRYVSEELGDFVD